MILLERPRLIGLTYMPYLFGRVAKRHSIHEVYIALIMYHWNLKEEVPMPFEKHTAMVTGASAGLGVEFCRQLAESCDVIIAVGRREDRLQSLAAELADQIEVHPVAVDLSRPEGVTEAIEALHQKGPVDYLVNNAGFSVYGKFASSDLSEQTKMVHLHVDATMALCRAALPFMQERGSGVIINVSSVGGFMPLARNAVYNATKAFLNSFSQSLQAEVVASGVRIQCLCPGNVRTEIFARETMKEFDASRVPDESWMEAADVVAISLEALEKDDVIVVPGRHNQDFVAQLQGVPVGSSS